jgi:hypothetical protein
VASSVDELLQASDPANLRADLEAIWARKRELNLEEAILLRLLDWLRSGD